MPKKKSRDRGQAGGTETAQTASSRRPGARTHGRFEDPPFTSTGSLGLLAFQRRVLEEAEDPENPLLERVKFLSILGSNLDEFFMVRAAGLAAQLDAGTVEVGPDRMTPRANWFHSPRSQEAVE